MRSPLSVDGSLTRLEAYAREWRESTLPDNVRRETAMRRWRMKVDRPSARFTLRALPGRDVQLEWTGQISPDGDGSLVNVSSAITRLSVVAAVTMTTIAVALAFFYVHAGATSLLFAAFIGLTHPIMADITHDRDRKYVEKVLGNVISARTDAPPA